MCGYIWVGRNVRAGKEAGFQWSGQHNEWSDVKNKSASDNDGDFGVCVGDNTLLTLQFPIKDRCDEKRSDTEIMRSVL